MPDPELAQYMPEHPVCVLHVEVPTISVQLRRLRHLHLPHELAESGEVLVQWFGEDYGGELRDRNLQFVFSLTAGPDSLLWWLHPERFRVAMLGPLKLWPDKETTANLLRKGGWSPDSTVLYGVSSHVGMDDGHGGTRPAAIITKVICLGDGLFGVIKPREYLNFAAIAEETAKLARATQRR